jgi:hypothetical protein
MQFVIQHTFYFEVAVAFLVVSLDLTKQTYVVDQQM